MADPVADPLNYVLIPLLGKINPGDIQGIKLYLQATNEIYKEAEKLEISVSNSKDNIYHFLSLANNHGCRHLAFMVDTGATANIIFRQVNKIQNSDMYNQERG